jgi:hypothetical protein
MTGKGRTPALGELLGGGALLAILTATVAFASEWGGALRAIEDHVNPQNHAMIVLAGAVETGQKIAVIETEVQNVKTSVEKNTETAEELKDEVAGVRSDLRLLLELNRRALARPPPAVAAESASAPPPE